jgi:hypothetical protein
VLYLADGAEDITGKFSFERGGVGEGWLWRKE